MHSHQTPSVLKDGEPVPEGEGMKKNPPAPCLLPPAVNVAEASVTKHIHRLHSY
ncbi:hypothetical protein CWATWH8502_3349 [Crocosphaera watsonii WH 8502]|uniref:Uncharacterized protein n=1 Tax=Crocosphaera watsonii WH 8502 TaxID=423474 RepID=T2I9I5_CROWT|nr:hypothetical protein CWATWH8502_3349 [Crocosphaera watsonii WH 8502]